MAVSIKKDQTILRRRPDLTTLVYGKVPPQAPDLEEAVLGACMLESDSFESVMEIIFSHECFYMDAHQKIYEAMCILYNNGNMVDLLTITEQLRKENNLEIIGGSYYLSRLTQSVLSSAHIQDHARIVMEKYFQREIIRICGSAIGEAYEDSTDPFELMERVETEIKNIADGIIGGTDEFVGETAMDVLMDIETQKENKTVLTGIASGYDELDNLTNGWQNSELIILAARPSQGKTALALNLAINSNTPTLVFSLESSKKALVKRMLASKNNIPFEDIRRGVLSVNQESVILNGMASFRQLPIKIDDKTQGIEQMKRIIRKWTKTQKANGKNKLLVIIDYLQLIRGKKDKNGNREQEVGGISRDLKLLASELDIAILPLSQLNRETEKTANKRPGLGNLRESGSLEQDANIVIFIWHEDVGKNEDGTPMIKTWLLVEKNRDGRCGPVELNFNGDIMKWINRQDLNQGSVASFIANNYQTRNPSEPQINWDDC